MTKCFFFLEVTQLELYALENRKIVKFDFFNGSEKSVLMHKKQREKKNHV